MRSDPLHEAGFQLTNRRPAAREGAASIPLYCPTGAASRFTDFP